MITLLGGKDFAWKSLKSESWNSVSEQSDNPNGFSALPGGKRDSDSKIKFFGEGMDAAWWTIDEMYPNRGSSFNLFFDSIDKTILVFLNQGLSVRCIKNADVVK